MNEFRGQKLKIFQVQINDCILTILTTYVVQIDQFSLKNQIP